MFGDNILAVDPTGTEASVTAITIDDLKDYYNKFISPSVSRFLIAGDIDEAKVKDALSALNLKWKSKEVVIPAVEVPGSPLNLRSILLMYLGQNNLLLLSEHLLFQEQILILSCDSCQL